MRKPLLLVAAVMGLCGSVHADTLEKIKSSGAVTMGVRESSGALSYTLGDGNYAGFHVELCRRAIANVQKQLGMARIDIKYVPVNSTNRIPLLQNGTIDLECGSTTNNAARQQQVSFAVTTFVEEIRIAVRTNSGIQSIAQLAGRKVATTSGTTSVQILRKHERAANVEFQEVYGKDHSESMLNLTSGKADAFVMDAQVLAGNIAQSRTPSEFRIVGEVLGTEPIAIMLRKDDPAFKASVDNTLRELMKSGEIAQLYDKWFMRPIPPTGAQLNLPASAGSRSAWASPNDLPTERLQVSVR